MRVLLDFASNGNQPFNAGIKYLRATLPDEIFTGDFASQLFIRIINYVW
jgi:hypothetical protein